MSWNLGRLIGTLAAGGVSISVITYLLALGIGIVLIAFTSLGTQMLNTRASVPIELLLTMIVIRVPSNLLVVTGISVSVYIACFLIPFRRGESFVADLRGLISGLIPRRRTNWMITMPLLASALLLVVVIVTLLQDAVGVSSGSLFNPRMPPPDYELFASLAYAPVAEEIGFRVTGLGFFVVLVVLWVTFTRRAVSRSDAPRPLVRASLLSLVSPDRGKRLACLPNVRENGIKGIHSIEWVGLGLTSFVFGIAHLFGGADWGIGKVTTAGLSGLALGFVYLVYGVYASILLHWFFDFYLSVFMIGADFLGRTLLLLDGLLGLFTLAVGTVGLGVAILFFVSRRRSKPPAEIPYIPPGPSDGPVRA